MFVASSGLRKSRLAARLYASVSAVISSESIVDLRSA
jgi:hypothetical protein